MPGAGCIKHQANRIGAEQHGGSRFVRPCQAADFNASSM
jgi:hypothetical protein